MPVSRTKEDELKELEADFLRSFAHHINGSRRDYSAVSNEALLERVSNKLTVDQVDTVLTAYKEGMTPSKSADLVTPDDVSDIRHALEDSFGCMALTEVKIGQRYCDFVAPKDIIAVEIKTARDRIDRAPDQVDQYCRWANSVYLAYDVCHDGKIPSEIRHSEVGLVKYDSGEIIEVKPADLTGIDPADRLTWMTYEALAKAARAYKIQPGGGKEGIATMLRNRLPDEELSSIFTEYLHSRG